jgi:hypothetical protein
MEKSRKNLIKIGAIVLCLLAAIVVLVLQMNSKQAHRGLDSIPSGDIVLIKCGNEQCGAVYQMNKKEYYTLVDEVAARMLNTPESPPPVACKECQEASARKAVKCTECGHVFFYGEKPNDYPDRCPKCGSK